MGNKLHVSNLSFSTNGKDLGEHFSAIGVVGSAKVMIDQASGRSKGFGFVEMENAADAQKCIEKLNGSSLNNRRITVTEARPFVPRAATGRSHFRSVESRGRF